MLRFSDAKKNDFAVFDSVENTQTRNAIKTAFKYIISLSNVSKTYIDDWDAEIFKIEDKWVTDKSQINKIFFERKGAEEIKTTKIHPLLVDAVSNATSHVIESRIKQNKQDIARFRRDIENWNRNIESTLKLIYTTMAEDQAFLRQQKEGKTSGLAAVEEILNKHSLDLWDIAEDSISFVCKTDTIIFQRDLPNKINRRYNLGRLILKIRTSDTRLDVYRTDLLNRWAYKNMSHPHYGTYLCYGGFSADFESARLAFDLVKVVDVFMRWKDTYNVASALTSMVFFNHHPAYTEYLEGDVFYGAPESEIADSGCFIAPPFFNLGKAKTLYPKYRYREGSDTYKFLQDGGPIDGVSYQKECPASEPRYLSSQDVLTLEEYLAWLKMKHPEGEYHGWIPPQPNCGVEVSVRWDNEDGKYITEDEYYEKEESEESEESEEEF
jgi:hypothetical protein